MKILTILFSLLGLGSQSHAESDTEVDDQLWVMVKTDEFFRSQNDLEIMDNVTALVESSNLGILDGHSSGAYQFEFNYFEVSNYSKAKSAIEKLLNSTYPGLTFTISNDYDMPYEKL